MATPIEMVRGGERITVYSEPKGDALAADGWQRVRDLTPAQQTELASRPPLPWAGFDDMTASQVLAQANGLPPDRLAAIVAYESATKGRVSIVGKLTGRPPVQGTQATEQPPVTVETVQESPLKTIETVKIVPADDAPKG